MSLFCAYCKRPLDIINSMESEITGFLHEETEYMCTNPRCEHGTRVIHQSSRPLEKHGYITLSMLNKKDPSKSWLRKLFREREEHSPLSN